MARLAIPSRHRRARPNTITLVVDNVADPAVHVGDLDGTASGAARGGRWNATVTILVHDLDHGAVAGATVLGTFSEGGSASCETGGDGTCSVTATDLRRNVAGTTFTVDDVTGAGPYDASANEPGTAITLLSPDVRTTSRQIDLNARTGQQPRDGTVVASLVTIWRRQSGSPVPDETDWWALAHKGAPRDWTSSAGADSDPHG